jgi:hypothetical protein
MVKLFEKYKNVWLMANTMAGETLLDFYRKSNLEEIIIPDSVYGCPLYFYCTKQCDLRKLENYCNTMYANEGDET